MSTMQEQLQEASLQLFGVPETVQIIIDECNLQIAARSILGTRIGYQHICDSILSGHRVAFGPPKIITVETDRVELFTQAMASRGMEVEAIASHWSNGKSKNRTDPFIHRAIYKAGDSDTDVIALVSGDGDFEPALRYLKENKGKRIEVYAILGVMSTSLWAVADRAEYLN